MSRAIRRPVLGVVLAASLAAVVAPPAASGKASRTLVRVTLDPAAVTAHVSGRLLLFMTDAAAPLDVITTGIGVPGARQWIAAREVEDWAPASTVDIDVDAEAWPTPLSQVPDASYQVMALLDVDRNANYLPLSPGDLRSTVVSTAALRAGAALNLRLTRREPAPRVDLQDGMETVEFDSPSLSAFWGRPITMRAVVVLPPDYARSQAKYPTVFWTHGFHTWLPRFAAGAARRIAGEMQQGLTPPMIWVLLEQAVPSGTHEFVDSPNNGPWGTALTSELIPHLERRYRMDARRSGRFLQGHSSGGWAALWLQVTYPDLFGGAWPTAPDPVDFRDFMNVNLYEAANMYRWRDGSPTPMLRNGSGPGQTLEDYARREAVLGAVGGQWASFEWVFSPRGPDGRPMPLFNRVTGRIDREVVAAWRRFDIGDVLERRARTLAPRLHGKLHVIVGTEDTYYLDRAVRLLEARIQGLGYGAKFTYLPGRTHFATLVNGKEERFDHGGLTTRITMQMHAVARPSVRWAPRVAPEPSTALAQ